MTDEKDKPDTPAPDTPAPDTPAPDTPAPDTPAPDTPAPAPSYAEEFKIIKATYDDKIKKLEEEHKKELEERTEVIKQLLTGNADTAHLIDDPASIADKINQKRKIIKW